MNNNFIIKSINKPKLVIGELYSLTSDCWLAGFISEINRIGGWFLRPATIINNRCPCFVLINQFETDHEGCLMLYDIQQNKIVYTNIEHFIKGQKFFLILKR